MADNSHCDSVVTVAEARHAVPAELRHDCCIHELFEAQAASVPDAIALRCEGRQLTFKALNSRANRLARRLRASGVGPETIVGLYIDRSLEMVVSMLGVLKAGGAFLPCDPTYPRDRLAYMVADARVPVILTLPKFATELPKHQAKVLYVSPPCESGVSPIEANLINVARPDNLAYVIYTSGSTGRPKGVLGLHRGAVNRMQWYWQTYPFGSGEVCCQKAPSGFVDVVAEVFTPIATGVPLVIIPDAAVRDPLRLIETLSTEHVTRISLVATLLRMILHTAPDLGVQLPKLRHWVSTGEELPLELQQAFFAAQPDAELLNLYGQTEASIEVSHWRCERGGNGAPVPIGRPIANNSLHIDNEDPRTVGSGREGELQIGGVGLARGYLNHPALTAEKFVPNPYDDQPGGRLFKSGDMARTRATGVIEYLGRADGQVKIRGQRIELGEIEAALHSLPRVREAIVLARERRQGVVTLVAYVVPVEPEAVTTNALRERLGERLPEAMIPAKFVFLDALPRTPSGKTDRNALRTTESGSKRTQDFVAPRTHAESRLAEIWADLLQVDGVGVNDDFFELGGDSLIATQAVVKIRQRFGVDLSVTRLFENPTVAKLMPYLEGTGRVAKTPEIGRAPAEASSTLSFAEQRLWFLEKLEESNPGYVIFSAWRLHGVLREDALTRSLAQLVARHEVLRTSYPDVDGVPTRRVATELRIPLPRIDLQAVADEDRLATARRRASEIVQQPFDLTRGPLFRIALIKLGPADQILLCAMHHIISDDRSMDILIRELGEFYDADGRDFPAALTDLPISYADFAHWHKGRLTDNIVKDQLSYWERQLASAPQVLDLQTDRQRPAVRTFRGSHHRFALSVELTTMLREVGAESSATVFMVLLTGFMTLLTRYSGQTDVVVGTPSTTRSSPETESLIGLFVNTLVLRAGVSGDTTWRELLGRVRSAVLGAQENQDVPLDRIIETLQPERTMGMNPLFQAIFAWQRSTTEALELRGLDAEPVNIESGISIVDVSLTMQDAGHALIGEFEYSSELFDADRISRMAGHYKNLLEAIAADPDGKISNVPLLTPQERRQVLGEWNNPITAVRKGCLHHLVTEQAERCPDAIAVTQGDQQLTFGALVARADRLARHLQSLGVGAEVFVGLCMERSPAMVAALLGILKSGGVLVPLDPAYPAERLAFMLDDADVSLVVTDSKSSEHLPAHSSRVVFWDSFDKGPSARGEEPPLTDVRPENLAYVIYTSGSTAKPKGVMVEHQAIVDHCQHIRRTFEVRDTDRILQFASLSFDPALEQIFSALITGATLVLLDDRVSTATEFQRQMTDQALSVINIPPDYWRQLAEEWADGPAAGVPSSLRLVIVGGDVFPANAISCWRRTPHHAARLLNAYGPTEATITSTTFEVAVGEANDGEAPRIALGRPVGNRTLYIRDRYENLQPMGVPGELMIGGTSLARGYLKRPALTAERFVPDPYGDRPGARLYRTGDVVNYLSDGALEFLGRIDEQVKIRGFRIEPSEVEAHLEGHADVSAAVVLKSTANPRRELLGCEVPDLARLAESIDDQAMQELLSTIERLSDAEVDRELAQSGLVHHQVADVFNRARPEFELSLHVKDKDFIRPPRDFQRNWILQRTLDEFVDDVQHLDTVSRRFVSSDERTELRDAWEASRARLDSGQLIIDDQQVMQDWQRPLMAALAEIVSDTHGDVLEVGFGMGIAATIIQERGVRSHTIIECNDDVIQSFEQWSESLGDRNVSLLRGKWQEVVGELGLYDGILFDTYPTSEAEFQEYVVESVTFAEPFFETAARCLRKGGVFTYYTNEVDSFSRRHQRLLFKHFSSFALSVVKPLTPPRDNVNWWADSMVAVRAVK